MMKFLYHTWYKHAGIFINTNEESYYMLKTNMHIDIKTNGKTLSQKYKKYVHLSYICSHLITKKLINNTATTASWTALKRLIITTLEYPLTKLYGTIFYQIFFNMKGFHPSPASIMDLLSNPTLSR